jgi:ribosomal-protein-alanine N-acetyltransferase
MELAPPHGPMTPADLDRVAAIECEAYDFPWSRRNFQDSLEYGYRAICARSAAGTVLGYSVMMPVVDEMHLLNLCVAPAMQRQGLGLLLLHDALDASVRASMQGMLLEVRPSNHAAIALYDRHGFAVIGRRRGYYAARHGREDALVMRLTFPEHKDVAA